MLRTLVSACVRRHGVVAVLILLALILGTWRSIQAPLDVFPEFVPAQVEIQTEAPGFSAQQVEELVTRPVETAVNGSAGLATLRSESIPGLSMVTVTFVDGLDVHLARQGIAERLAELAGTLPQSVATPKISPLVSSTMDLLRIGLVSDKLDSFALRDLAEWTVRPRLLAVPGVAHVIPLGGDVRQIQIQPDADTLAAYDLTTADVMDAARAALALRGAGFIDTPAQRIVLRTPTPTPDLGTLSEAVVSIRSGTPILIRDVAKVSFGPALRNGDALIMGRRGVLVTVASQLGANTLSTTRDVERALTELEPALVKQGVGLYKDMHRPANFIERALQNLRQSLLIAAALILIVLYLFLRDVRASLVAFLAIPLSLLAAIVLLMHFGQTLNTMTLGGFAVALGVLVDDGIIDVENILRRLRATPQATLAQRLQVILESSLEVRGPVIYATVIAVAVFVPVLFVSSVQGRFIGPLALAFILAVLASLLVAMSATPALAALLLSKGAPGHQPAWLSYLKRWQRTTIEFISRHLSWVAAALLVLVIAASAALPFFGGTFMPDFKEGHFVMQVGTSIAGTSLDEMQRVGERITREVRALPYVKTVEQQIGRAELSEGDTFPPHRSEFHVELKPDATVDQSEVQRKLREILAGYPGLQSEVITFLGDRISESLSGLSAQVAIKVYGSDLDALDKSAERIVAALRRIPGITDLQFKRQGATPVIGIQAMPDALAAAGVSLQPALDILQAAYAGTKVGETFAGTRTVDVTVTLPDAARHDPSRIGALLVGTPHGPVPLAQLARIEVTQDRYDIQHDGGRRLAIVTFNVAGQSLEKVVAEAQQAVETVTLPAGAFVEFAGAAKAAIATRHELTVYALIALVVILLIFFSSFRWPANSWLALLNLPFSLIGSIAAIAIFGLGLSLGTVVGLVTVFGISARNGILQLSHYEHLVHVEGRPWSVELMFRGANERLTPILMTAAVTALGLAPLAFGLNRPGQEIEGPMAVTVLGGLLSSTVLNLLVLPPLAWRFAKPRNVPADPDSAR